MAGPPTVLRRLFAGHVAHLLDAEHGRESVAARLEVGHRGEQCEAAGGARPLVPAGWHAREVRVGRGEQPAEVALAAEQFGDEIADVRDLDVVGLEVRLREARDPIVSRMTSAISRPSESFTYTGGARDPFASLLTEDRSGPEFADLLLVGIYLDLRRSSNSVAVLRDKTTQKRYKLRVGDRLGRLQVAQIRQSDVVFTIEDIGFERQETLSLRKREAETP